MSKSIKSLEGNSIAFFVRSGYFATCINILKVYKDAGELERKPMRSGAFSNIYLLNMRGKYYVVKSQPVREQDRAALNHQIDEVIREFTFFKIASALGIGPCIENIFGYDIICYNDRIEFAMEHCGNDGYANDKYEQLFEAMKEMHSLKIVHRDMKPDNVDWSPHFSRWVFLDFGFATVLEEEVGWKSRTKFIGTYSYTTRELQKTYDLSQHGQVDFYYNDLYGLRKVIGRMKADSETEKAKKGPETVELMIEGEVLEVPIDEDQFKFEMVQPSFNYFFFSFSILFKMKFFFFIQDYT